MDKWKWIRTKINCNIFDKIPIKEHEEGCIPAYTRTDLTDKLHDIFGFRTDYEITTLKEMKKALKNLKNWFMVRTFC